MPTYDYACPACGGFEALRSLSQRDEPLPLPGLRHRFDPRLRGRTAPGLPEQRDARCARDQRACPSRAAVFA